MKFLLTILVTTCFSFKVQAAIMEALEVARRATPVIRRYMSTVPVVPASSELATSLKRALTAGEEAHHTLQPDYRNAFFYSKLLKRLGFTTVDGFHNFSSLPTTDFERFHRLLAQRLDERAAKVRSNAAIGIHKSGKVLNEEEEKTIDLRLNERIVRDKPFVTGQIIHLKGTTSFPINLFTLTQKGSEYVNFGTPLQHGFYLPTFKEYFDAIALLRTWAAYRETLELYPFLLILKSTVE